MMRHTTTIVLGFSFAIALFLAGCEPQPGTPGFVIKKIELGQKPTKEEFGLLGPAQVPALIQTVSDRSLPPLAHMAGLDVLLAISWPDKEKDMRELLKINDPQVRLRVADSFQAQSEPASGLALIETLKTETHELVRDHLGRAVQRLGMRDDPNPDLLSRILDMAKSMDTFHRESAARALGGWMGRGVADLLEQMALKDPNPKVRAAAAKSLVMPSVRYFDDIVPRLGRLMDLGDNEVKVWGLVGILQNTRTDRGPFRKACDPDLLVKILAHIPDLKEKAIRFSNGGNLRQKSAADNLLTCFEPPKDESDTEEGPPSLPGLPNPGPGDFPDI